MQFTHMIIAYIYERPFSEGADMGAERTYADYPVTRRSELNSMIAGGGMRAGDTLRVRAVSDLGRGQESKRLQQKIADLGVTLEVHPNKINVRERGRPTRAAVDTIENYDRLCGLWFSPMPADECFRIGGEVTGGDMGKSRFEYLCGSRHGRDADAKRAAFLKRLKAQKERDT